MKLEVGNAYLDEDGKVVEIVSVDCGEYVSSRGIKFTEDGRIRGKIGYSLVSEHTIRLAVGKTYKSRCGELVKITSKTNHKYYPFADENDKTYTILGTYNASLTKDSNDLLEEINSDSNVTLSYGGNIITAHIKGFGNVLVAKYFEESGDVLVFDCEYSGGVFKHTSEILYKDLEEAKTNIMNIVEYLKVRVKEHEEGKLISRKNAWESMVKELIALK